MTMKTNRQYKFNITHMWSKGSILSWDDYAVRISLISRIWVGPIPKKMFPIELAYILLFIALSNHQMVNIAWMLAVLVIGVLVWALYYWYGRNVVWVHMKLDSGELFSFQSSDAASVHKLYHYLCGLADGSSDADVQIDMDADDTMINVDEIKEEEEVPAGMAIKAQVAQNGQLVTELQTLHQSYLEKSDLDSGILQLIDDVVHLVGSGDREELKSAFKKLVESGLIHDCNKLGLNALVQEIKSYIY